MKKSIFFAAFGFLLLQGLTAQTPLIRDVVPTVSSLPSPVIVYSLPNYGGTSQSFSLVGTYTLNFTVRSVRVPEGYYVTMGTGAECIGPVYLGSNYIIRDTPASAVALTGERRCGIIIERISTTQPGLRFNLRTGGDDLRQNSQATATVRLTNGTTLSIPLNNGANWGNNSTNTVNYSLPRGTLPTHIRSIVINFASGSSGPFDTGDNWNLDLVQIHYSIRNTPMFFIANGEGRPWVRFTGSQRTATVPRR
jgi:hypothetical protein